METKNSFDAAAIWQEHEPYIRKFCTYKLQSQPDEIEDCIQEVFIALSQAEEKGRIIAYPKAWLTKVADNLIKDFYEKARKASERTVAYDAQILERTQIFYPDEDLTSLSEEQISQLKEEVFSHLTEPEQKLLHDRYAAKKSFAEIASEQNTTASNIRQRLYRLKQKTKAIIKQLLDD